MLTKIQKTNIIEQYGKTKNDVGSCEVQIALLSERIKNIASHLKFFPKDLHSQRGLVLLVGKRKAFFNYLKKHNPKSFEAVSRQLKTSSIQ
jgi:small subunit ribosomal protein S15